MMITPGLPHTCWQACASSTARLARLAIIPLASSATLAVILFVDYWMERPRGAGVAGSAGATRFLGGVIPAAI